MHRYVLSLKLRDIESLILRTVIFVFIINLIKFKDKLNRLQFIIVPTFVCTLIDVLILKGKP